MSRRKHRNFPKWQRDYSCKKEADDRVKIVEALGWELCYVYLDIGCNKPSWYFNGSYYSFDELPAYEKIRTPKQVRFLINNKTEEQKYKIRDELYLEYIRKIHGIHVDSMDEYYDYREKEFVKEFGL